MHSTAPLSWGCGTTRLGVTQGSEHVTGAGSLGLKVLGKVPPFLVGTRCDPCPPPPWAAVSCPSTVSLLVSPPVLLCRQINKQRAEPCAGPGAGR